MLSHHERRQLRQIEQWFDASDPRFSRRMSGTIPARNARRGLATVVLVYTLIVFLIILGVVTNSLLIFAGALPLSLAACIHIGTRG